MKLNLSRENMIAAMRAEMDAFNASLSPYQKQMLCVLIGEFEMEQWLGEGKLKNSCDRGLAWPDTFPLVYYSLVNRLQEMTP